MSTQESMREQLERPIAQLESLSQMLFSALASNQVPPDPPIEELAACDIMLAEGMRSARIHLLKQQKIDSLMDEVYELEAQLVEIVEYLAKGQRELQAIMEEGRDRLTAAEIATRGVHNFKPNHPIFLELYSWCAIQFSCFIRHETRRLYVCSSKCTHG